MPDDLVPSPDDQVPAAPTRWRMAEHWPELVTALTEQSVESATLLLRGLELLERKGRLTPAEHKVLALPAERLRHAGISAQQIVRFQSGRVRQSHEKIDLAYLLDCVLQERRNELALLGLTVWRKFRSVDVLLDPTLGFSLAQAMLDWSLPFGHRIDLRLDLAPGDPARARLRLKTSGETLPTPDQVSNDNLNWLLLRQIAATDGAIEVERSLVADGVLLSAVFGRTMAPPAEPATPAETPRPDIDSQFKSVSGAQVLIVTPDPDTRATALAIIAKLGVQVDACAGAMPALAALAGRRPDLIVLDTVALPPAEADTLREALTRDHPELPRVEIVAPGAAPVLDIDQPCVARDALPQSLGSAVMFTLSRVM